MDRNTREARARSDDVMCNWEWKPLHMLYLNTCIDFNRFFLCSTVAFLFFSFDLQFIMFWIPEFDSLLLLIYFLFLHFSTFQKFRFVLLRLLFPSHVNLPFVLSHFLTYVNELHVVKLWIWIYINYTRNYSLTRTHASRLRIDE